MNANWVINEVKTGLNTLMFYLEILKWTNHFIDNFTYAFDCLSWTEIKVSLNTIYLVYIQGVTL